MTNSTQAHQVITPYQSPVTNIMTTVMTNPDLVKEISKQLTAAGLGRISSTSKICYDEVKNELQLSKPQFLDELKILKNNKDISKKLFDSIRKNNTFLKSKKNYILFKTFLNSLKKFKEIATKIKTQIETQQNTNPEINIATLNNLKNIFLKSLIFKPHIIETINPDKIGLNKTSNSYYLGEIENEKANGYGTETFKSGGSYVGHWVNGQPHGQGTKIFANRDIYIGHLENGQPHGQGTITYANGDTYVGHLENGKYHGQGTYTKTNGTTYIGYWKNGQRHGHGTFTWSNGDTYVGEFKDDLRHGQGRKSTSNFARVGEKHHDFPK